MSTTIDDLWDDEAADATLVAFAQAQDTPAGADLSEWIARHPLLARDFARLAADRWAGEAGTAPADAAQRLRGIGMAALRAYRPAPSPHASPLTSLLAAAKAAGSSAEGVARKLDLPVALFWKLHRRLLAPASLPHTLVESLAEAVNRTRDEVAAYLQMPPRLAAGASYRSDDMPAVGEQESFADALRSEPEATEAHRRRWLGAE